MSEAINDGAFDLAGNRGEKAVEAELPSPDTKRWVVRRKAVIVEAVRSGRISLDEACRRYNLSVEEFQAWEQAIDSHGVPGLRVTRLQIYRNAPPRLPPGVRRF